MIKETFNSSSPFDLYDVFGYIIPGLVFLLLNYLVIDVFIEEFPLKSEFLYRLHDIGYRELIEIKESVPWWLELTLLISTICMIYISGHIIASISSLIIDKYLVKKIAGYPSQRLFNLTHRNNFGKGFYKLLFFIINLYLIRLMFFANPDKLELQILFLFSISLIGFKIFLTNFKTKNGNFHRLREQSGSIMGAPFNALVHFIVRSLGLNEAFSSEFIEEYKKKFERVFKLSFETAGTNVYWLSYCYVLEKNEHMRDVIRHFIRLYGFTRNLGTALFLVFILTLIIKLNGTIHHYRLNMIAIISIASLVILTIRYYYLYYNYYSKFIFRAFYYLDENMNRK